MTLILQEDLEGNFKRTYKSNLETYSFVHFVEDKETRIMK